MDSADLPSTTTEQARTYLVSGSLGVLFFVASGSLWDSRPFLGSLFLELGGGAFIVFLLEFLLPSSLGYADRVRRVALFWSHPAITALQFDFTDDEARDLMEVITNERFPARPSVRDGVSDTRLRTGRRRVLQRTVPIGPTVVRYYSRRRRLVLRAVVIIGLNRRSTPDRGTS